MTELKCCNMHCTLKQVLNVQCSQRWKFRQNDNISLKQTWQAWISTYQVPINSRFFIHALNVYAIQHRSKCVTGNYVGIQPTVYLTWKLSNICHASYMVKENRVQVRPLCSLAGRQSKPRRPPYCVLATPDRWYREWPYMTCHATGHVHHLWEYYFSTILFRQIIET